MRKFFIALLTLVVLLPIFSGCKKDIDYSEYVSEKRFNIYRYADDLVEIKIYVSQKESPYCLDGVKGEVSPIAEFFVRLDKSYEEVDISCKNVNGEMSYKAVEKCYYLSLATTEIIGESVDVAISCDGESKNYKVQSVLYSGVITCENALKCVVEYNSELFENLTENGIFNGEIYVRLLFDEGCFYYVGVCSKDKKITAYLVDGEKAKILASKTTQNEQ